jgi:hypothetical protein
MMVGLDCTLSASALIIWWISLMCGIVFKLGNLVKYCLKFGSWLGSVHKT